MLSDGSDYIAVSNTITFATGQREIVIPVTTTENSIAEQLEFFTAVLSNPSEGLTVGDQDTAIITVEDDEGII